MEEMNIENEFDYSDKETNSMERILGHMFDRLKITTMTLIFDLEGVVNLQVASFLLDVMSNFDSKILTKQKNKIICKEPGNIFHTRYGDCTRGIFNGGSKKIFKNAITMMISTIEKNLNIKLCTRRIHMCGAKSSNNGIEGVNHLITKLNDIQEHLNYINDHPIETENSINWIKMKSKGDTKFIPYSPIPIIRLINQVNPDDIPDGIDKKITLFFLRQISHYNDYDVFTKFLDWAAEQRYVIESESLSISLVNKIMVNYNYDLGFKINRVKLYEEIKKRKIFVANYFNIIDKTVSIKIPYEIEGDENSNSKHYITFLVYRSGKITQSGPDEELNKLAFIEFQKIISEIRKHISHDRTNDFKFTYTKNLPTSPKIDYSKININDSPHLRKFYEGVHNSVVSVNC